MCTFTRSYCAEQMYKCATARYNVKVLESVLVCVISALFMYEVHIDGACAMESSNG